MKLPKWYGTAYPSYEDLIMFAESFGVAFRPTDMPMAVYAPPMYGHPPGIYIPRYYGPLQAVWELAHEIGHLCRHSGHKNELFYSKDEAQANHWAACALIPKARIDYHQNASIDTFMAALSANYEPLPLYDCHVRTLAHEIATIRIEALEQGN
jgi:hypothetical protein